MSDWVDVLVGAANIYFLWQQNQIFRKQNDIFAAQAERTKAPPEILTSRLKRYWPMLAMAGLVLFTWIGLGLRYYLQETSDAIPEFDAPNSQSQFYASYGHDHTNCLITVRGNSLLSYQDRYRMAAACLVSDGSTDMLDVRDFSVGREYDIVSGDVLMTAIGDPEAAKRITNGVNYFVLLIPPKVQTSQFVTLRQARALGVKIKFVGSERGNTF
jgi:hypothetical protein